MGTQQTKFKEETIKEFEAATPFNRSEIYHAFKVFQQLYTDHVQETEKQLQPLFTNDYINIDVTLPIGIISENLPALRVNPFRTKMCEIFATSGNEMMTFVEFLDMVSAFSPKNSIQQKTFHAFQIFDIDGDGIISHDDISKMLDMITDEVMSTEEKDIIVASVFKEVNKEANCDGLSTEDFHYAISQSPDFASTFSFRL